MVDMASTSDLIVANSRRTVRLPVTTGLNGAPLELTVSVATGDPTGPVLTLVSTLHGGEWFSISPLKRVFERVDTDSLNGTLIVARDIAFPRIIPCKREHRIIAKTFQQPAKIGNAALDVLAGILAVTDTKPTGGGGHQLHQTFCTSRTNRVDTACAFNGDDSKDERG